MADSVSERPSFTEAFSADVSPAAESLPAETPTETAPAVDAAPVSEVPAAAVTPEIAPAEGPVPYARFKEINESKKSLEATLERLKWAETVDRSQFEQGARLGQQYQQDRGAFINQLLTEALTDPQLAPVVRSHAARVLGTRLNQPQPEALPDFPIMDGQGQVVAQLGDVVQRHIAAALAKEVGPLKQTVESAQAERAAQAQRQEIDQAASAQYTQAQQWPHFSKHEPDIAKAFQEHPEWSLQDAYIAVVVPKLQAQEQAATLDDLKTKAAARTVNPSAAVVATTHRPKSLTDASLQW